ncbi:hypothetical protein PVAP13_9KG169013 [Panicum virgatum]|jgi:hypothetical protein|uniref:Uncharacterized protein n=1 Tax=Panicum virgatum TaxID=38727 RepID=A0A8T0NR27_PANVG|nr:hypothetical protein PVAP13_9KG169013 [Panicum virgatum]
MSLSLLFGHACLHFFASLSLAQLSQLKGQKRNMKKEIAKRTDAQNTAKKSDAVIHAPCLS